jgi:hypothetical protein
VRKISSMRVRKERTFYGDTQAKTEALAAAFAVATNGKVFYSAPVLSPSIGKDDYKKPYKWQVDVEYYEDDGKDGGLN